MSCKASSLECLSSLADKCLALHLPRCLFHGVDDCNGEQAEALEARLQVLGLEQADVQHLQRQLTAKQALLEQANSNLAQLEVDCAAVDLSLLFRGDPKFGLCIFVKAF